MKEGKKRKKGMDDVSGTDGESVKKKRQRWKEG